MNFLSELTSGVIQKVKPVVHY